MDLGHDTSGPSEPVAKHATSGWGFSAGPIKVISIASNAVPAVKFALGLAGIAAAASIVSTFAGSGLAAFATMAFMLLGMVALYLISVVTSGGKNGLLSPQATVILWAVTLYICFMLTFLTTALGFGWPAPFAKLIGVQQTITAFFSRSDSHSVTAPVTPAAPQDSSNRTGVRHGILRESCAFPPPKMTEFENGLRGIWIKVNDHFEATWNNPHQKGIVTFEDMGNGNVRFRRSDLNDTPDGDEYSAVYEGTFVQDPSTTSGCMLSGTVTWKIHDTTREGRWSATW